MARGLWIAITTSMIAAATVVAQPPAGNSHKVTVALLPLDAEARLALYGQPVAAEVARALAAAGLDVAMVGQGDPVPTRAVLVVDGKIRKASPKGNAIILDLSVRDPARAEVLARVSSTASSMTAIDRAAGEVAQKLVPAVREQLAARQPKPKEPDPGAGPGRLEPAPDGNGQKKPPPPVPPPMPGILLVASSQVPLDGRPEAMVVAVAPAFEQLIGAVHFRPVAPVRPIGDAKDALAGAIGTAGARYAVVVDVLAFQLELKQPKEAGAPVVPMGRARARVRIVASSGAMLFDRVVRTDTVVGRGGDTAAQVASLAGAQLAEVVRVRLLRATGGAR